jgi:hypothetical protein
VILDGAATEELAAPIGMRATDVVPVLGSEDEHVVVVVTRGDDDELLAVHMCVALEVMPLVPAQVVRLRTDQRHQVVPRLCPALCVVTFRLHR